MAFVPLMLIVDRACAAPGNRANRGARSAACDGANSRATGRSDRHSLDGSADPVSAMNAVIDHIGNCHVLR